MDLFNEHELSQYIETGIVPDFKDLLYQIKTHIHGHERPITQDECIEFIDKDFEWYLEELDDIKRKIHVLQEQIHEHIKNIPLN
jgi:hypothetical protein